MDDRDCELLKRGMDEAIFEMIKAIAARRDKKQLALVHSSDKPTPAN